VRKKIFCTGPTKAAKAEQNLLYRNDKRNEPAKKSPFTSVSTVSRSHPSLNSLEALPQWSEPHRGPAMNCRSPKHLLTLHILYTYMGTGATRCAAENILIFSRNANKCFGIIINLCLGCWQAPHSPLAHSTYISMQRDRGGGGEGVTRTMYMGSWIKPILPVQEV
jgi:hypothetical protein